MRKEDFTTILKLLKDCYIKDKRRIIVTVLLSFTSVLKPYVLVILLGNILNYFTCHDGKTIVGHSFIMLLIYHILGIWESRLIESYYSKMDYTKEAEEHHMNYKAMHLKYSSVENTRVNELRFAPFSKSYYGVIGWCLINIEKLLEGIISLLILGIICLPTLINNDLLYFKIAGLFILLLVLILSIINYKYGVQYTEKAKKIADNYDNEYNKKRYYIDKFSNIEFQKDVRLNSWKYMLDREMSLVFEQLKKGESKQANMYIKKQLISALIASGLLIVIYVYVGILASKNYIAVGEAVTFAASIVRFSQNMNQFAVGMGNMKSVSLLAADYLSFMDLKESEEHGTKIISKEEAKKIKFEFCDVTFKYPNSDNCALKNINIEIDFGKHIAFVGRNGSGKTTFIKLLCRLYEPSSGVIKLNGVDIREYDIDDYMNIVSVVFQDYRIFAFGIGENIAATDNFNKEQVNDALKKVGLYSRINELNNSIYEIIGRVVDDKGVDLSGGEKQKMAIARAIYKDAPIVIMDEPTAALDPVSETEIYSGFDKLVGDRAAIYISHRLSSCKFCDEVFVFNDGQIVQRGKHEELQNEDGIYRELWNAQSKYYI